MPHLSTTIKNYGNSNFFQKKKKKKKTRLKLVQIRKESKDDILYISVANFKIRKKKYVCITRNNKSCACLRSLTQLTTCNDNLSFRQPINLKSKTKKSTATSIVRSKSLTSTSSYSSRKLFFLAHTGVPRACE